METCYSCILNHKVPWIYKQKISNNHKLLSSFLGKNLTPIKLLNLTAGGDNLAGHCFVLRDLIPIKFLNKSWLLN